MGVQPEWYSSIAWRKSTQNADQGNCIEVANGIASVLVRDSQDRPGPILTLPRPVAAALEAHPKGWPQLRLSVADFPPGVIELRPRAVTG